MVQDLGMSVREGMNRTEKEIKVEKSSVRGDELKTWFRHACGNTHCLTFYRPFESEGVSGSFSGSMRMITAHKQWRNVELQAKPFH